MKEIFRSEYSKLFLAGLILFILAAIFSQGYNNPDEHFQILEFCNYILGKSPASDLPWEFKDKLRPALQPYLAYGIVKVLGLVSISNPFTIAIILRLITGVLAWFIICKLSLLLVNDFVTEQGKRFFILLNLFLWFIPYLSVRFSSENYSSITFLYAVYFLLRYFKSPFRPTFSLFFIVGTLLGFSFFFRFQVGIAISGLLAWLVFIKKAGLKNIFFLLSGASATSAFCIFLDCHFYGSFQLTPLTYFNVNLVQHRAASFGVAPWWYYFPDFLLNGIPPISALLLLAFGIGIYRKPGNVFSLCVIPFLLVHFFTAHKELRFLFPMVFGLLYISSIGIDSLLSLGKPKLVKLVYIIMLIVNIPLLLYRTMVPAQEAVNCYWFLYNYAEEHKTILLCKNENPYEVCDLRMNFYKSPNLSIIILQSDSAILNYVHNNKSDRLLLFSNHVKLDSALNKILSQRIYSLFPEWVLRYDINDWQSRTKVWSIFEVQNKQSPPQTTL